MAGTTDRVLRDERGMALPLALLVLVILMALTMAFSSLATTEPTVVRNLSMGAQARGFAESGMERAIWALSNPTDASGIPNPMSGSTAASPYNGTSFFTVSTNGGFTLTVSEVSGVTNERTVTAVGWAPDHTGTLRAAKKLQVTLMRHRFTSWVPPGALSVMGTLEVGGNAQIDARSNQCSGTPPNAGTVTQDATLPPVGAAKIWGPGNNTANETADMQQNTGASAFSFKMTSDEFNILRDQAKAAGTYYQGSVSFNTSNPMPNGIVFVDTTTGADLVGGATPTPPGQRGSVDLSGNLTWSGWLVVAGGVSVSGTVDMTGMVYAQNDFTFTGNGDIKGTVVSENRIDSVATVIDSTLTGSANITYNCGAAQNGGGAVTMSANAWYMKTQTYREVEGQ